MTSEFATDVLICGAGAAGLTLAIALARCGVSFTVIEKMPEPFRGSRGKGIQPRTQEIFEDLAILDRIVAAGGQYPPVRKYEADGSFTDGDIGERTEPKPSEPYRIPLMIPQYLTENIMRQRLAELGQEVRFGYELETFAQDENGVNARIAGPDGEKVLRCRYLVGADGGNSIVRRVLDISFPGKTLGVRAIVADVSLTGLSREVWHQFNDGNMERLIVACPLGGTNLFQLQAPIPFDVEVDLSVQGLQRMMRERTARDDIEVHSCTWASAYAMNARLAERYRVGRIFLTGDAAHIHPPTGGQGLNASVQDAYNLGWKIAAVVGGADDRLLDSYEEERRPVAEAVLGLSSRLLDEQREGRTQRGRETQQLDIGYSGSRLAQEPPHWNGVLRAGDRAPDAPLKGAAGQPTRLFKLFQGSHWTLLLHGDATAIAARKLVHPHYVGSNGDVCDVWGHFTEGYALPPGGGALIRPDGYIGAIFDDGTGDALEAYFDMIGLRAIGGVMP